VSCAGLILAAGESRRMGRPKALLPYGGETFLDRLVRLFAERCSPVVVVLGAEAAAIRAASAPRALFVENPDYRLGQTTSKQCGLRALKEAAEGILFTLVDHPAVSEATLDALLRERPGPAPLVRLPRYQGRRGHPIWFARALAAEFLALPPTGAARDVVHRHADRTEFLDLDDPAIVADIDDPAAYRALTGGSA